MIMWVLYRTGTSSCTLRPLFKSETSTSVVHSSLDLVKLMLVRLKFGFMAQSLYNVTKLEMLMSFSVYVPCRVGI